MPSDPPALVNARRLFQAGRLDEARVLVQAYLRRDPNHAEANSSMAVLLAHGGDDQRALFHAQRAVAASPSVPDFHSLLATILVNLGKRDEGIAAARRAIELGSNDATLLLNLVPWCWENGDHEGAHRAAERAMKLDPSRARGTCASVLANIGRLDDAIALLRAELAREPEALDALLTLAALLNYQAGADAVDVFGIHRRCGEVVEREAAAPRGYTGSKDPSRRLRIGLASPDFYSHSVAFFAEPIIRHLDRSGFEVLCYSSRAVPDATTQRLKSLADGWRDTAGKTDGEIIELIRTDAIDILIDLVGLTTGRITSILAARPAPVQVTAIGYPNTTGLRSVGFRIVDSITDPPGSERFATESLIRLPGCFLCYQPLADAPAPSDTPPSASGPITFGSFNTAQKIVQPVIETWSQVANAIPGSRLLLKGTQFTCPMVRATFTKAFAAAGLDPARLELLPPVKEKSSHLSIYNRIDVTLDSFPYNGTTTTCEALYMGVPVVTLRGHAHAGRVGASLLSAVGLPELIADSPDEYVHIASRLAQDKARLTELRRILRPRMLASPLCDGPRYGTAFGNALRDMWLRYCGVTRAIH